MPLVTKRSSSVSVTAVTQSFKGLKRLSCPSKDAFDAGKIACFLLGEQRDISRKSILCQLAKDNLLVFQMCYSEQSPLRGSSGHPLMRLLMSEEGLFKRKTPKCLDGHQ